MSKPLCKICNASTQDLADWQSGVDYHHCPFCEYVFADQSALISPEEEKAIYLMHENTPDNVGYIKMFTAFIERAIVPHDDHIKTSLDFGCGPGPVLASLLQNRGYETEVYDPHFAKHPDVLSRHFDLITATEVLEHLVYPMVELRRLAQLLNPLGILAVMTRFHPNNADAFQNWWYRKDPTHIGFYTPVTMKQIAGLLGLELIDHDHRHIAVYQKTNS